MNRFAQLLDRLGYEPGRNNKLRLMHRIFPDRAGPGARLGAGRAHRRAVVPARQAGPHPRADRGAHRPGAVRAILRLRRRPVRDRGADVAAPVQRAETPAAPDALGRRGKRLRRWARRSCPRSSPRWLDSARRNRALGAAQARDRRPSHRRLGAPRQDRGGGAGRQGCAGHRTDLAGAGAALSRAVRLDRGPRREACQPAIRCRSGRRCWRTPSRRPSSRRSIPAIHGGMEMGRHPGAGRRPSRP